ncbi:MAG: hypothetical protein RR674_00780 [Anaerorhabdus sp.]
MRKIFIVLIALLLVGCGKKAEEVVVVPTPGTDEIVVTTPEPTETPTTEMDNNQTDNKGNQGNDTTKTKHQYVGYGVVDADYDFFIEGNKCVFDDYVIVKLMKVPGDRGEIGFEIGSHCLDEPGGVQGGVVNMKMDNLDEQPDFEFDITKKYKLYYSFPEGFEPTTYLNYVDYATKIAELD